MLRILLAAVLSAAAATAAAREATAPPTVREAWVRAAPPTATVRSAYLVLSNPGERPIALVGARSPAFGRIEVHDMTMDDGVMRMRRLARLEVAPGGEVALAPGGRHLMLMDPLRPLAPGDRVEVTLEFEPPVAPLRVEFEVADAAARTGADDHHEHHDHHDHHGHGHDRQAPDDGPRRGRH